jgi:hypothetical protein
MFHEIENHITRSKMSNREMVKKMTKEQVLDIMMESINADNKAMGVQAGLSEAELNTQIAQSQPSLSFMMSNIYDKLKESGAIA